MYAPYKYLDFLGRRDTKPTVGAMVNTPYKGIPQRVPVAACEGIRSPMLHLSWLFGTVYHHIWVRIPSHLHMEVCGYLKVWALCAEF